MSLYEKLSQDLVDARKNRDESRLSIIQVAFSAVKNEWIDKKRDLTDVEVQAVIAKQVKQLRDALKDFEAAKRDDLAEKNKKEIALLETYLPSQMPDEEIEKVIAGILSQMTLTNTPSDAGKIMGRVMSELKGKVDGGKVKELVAKYLANLPK